MQAVGIVAGNAGGLRLEGMADEIYFLENGRVVSVESGEGS